MKKFIKWHKEFTNKFMVMTEMDSYQIAWLSWFKGLAMGIILMILLSGCYGTYYISDAEYSDLREEHASITYYNNQIYWGWHSGYYYYYGAPHYYPWYYYYNACPPNHYHTTTHVIITRPVNKPTHRPNWNKPNRPTHKPNTNVIVKPNKNNTKINIRTNKNKNNIIVKPNKNKTNNRTVKPNRNKTNNNRKSNNRKPK